MSLPCIHSLSTVVRPGGFGYYVLLLLIRVNIRQVKWLLGSQAGREMGRLLDLCQVIMKMTFPNRSELILRKSLIYVIEVELSGWP